jgi:hypothetical protein
MLPSPLHPAVVHFPIVFAVLLPVAALLALWAIRRGAAPRRAWALPLAFAMALTASGWVALETGEAEEDRVEAFVGEAPIHQHEEAAERFLLFAGVVTLVSAAGMLAGTVGTAARLVASVGTLVVLAAGVQVGRAGGELVYEHGAAQAYVSASALSPQMERAGEWKEEHDR